MNDSQKTSLFGLPISKDIPTCPWLPFRIVSTSLLEENDSYKSLVSLLPAVCDDDQNFFKTITGSTVSFVFQLACAIKPC